MKRLFVLVTAVSAAIGAVGCGGSGDESRPALRDGVYEYTLTEEYLLEKGISSHQALAESGLHEVTLDDGEFVDRWQSASGSTETCRGTYDVDGNRITFRWTSGCRGDWRMTCSVEADRVTWSDIESLPPYDSGEDQLVNEVFNSVPWTRVGDVPGS